MGLSLSKFARSKSPDKSVKSLDFFLFADSLASISHGETLGSHFKLWVRILRSEWNLSLMRSHLCCLLQAARHNSSTIFFSFFLIIFLLSPKFSWIFLKTHTRKFSFLNWSIYFDFQYYIAFRFRTQWFSNFIDDTSFKVITKSESESLSVVSNFLWPHGL